VANSLNTIDICTIGYLLKIAWERDYAGEANRCEDANELHIFSKFKRERLVM
jgi:hypothetical protein